MGGFDAPVDGAAIGGQPRQQISEPLQLANVPAVLIHELLFRHPVSPFQSLNHVPKRANRSCVWCSSISPRRRRLTRTRPRGGITSLDDLLGLLEYLQVS